MQAAFANCNLGVENLNKPAYNTFVDELATRSN
jgi:hypothetical protein